jgi:hypothetical protein
MARRSTAVVAPERTIIPSIALVTPARACGTMAAPSLLTRANELIE